MPINKRERARENKTNEPIIVSKCKLPKLRNVMNREEEQEARKKSMERKATNRFSQILIQDTHKNYDE